MDFDSLKGKAERLAADHDDQIDGGLDKAEDLAKNKVAGHDDQIEQGFDKIKGFVPDGDDPQSSAR
ncbi:MAG: antitoxin [Actinomycetota bacterium]|nr:antitoxin [Actinomycetota bacterium]